MDVSEILSELDDHGFNDTAVARKMSILNSVYWKVCSLKPWRFLEKSINLNFAGGSMVASNNPSTVRAVMKAWNVGATMGGRRIRPWRTDDFYETFASNLTLAGTPYLYFIEGDGQGGYNVNFYPVPPSGSGLVTMRYLQRPAELLSTDLEAAIVIPPQHHRDVLVNGCLVRLYAMEDDPELSQYFKSLYDEAVQDMDNDLWVVQYDQPDFIHVIDPEDYDLDF